MGGMKKLLVRVECQRANGKAAGGRENLVFTMAQLWAPQEDGWRIMVFAAERIRRGSRAQAAPPPTPNTRLYSDPSEAHAELTEALNRAAKEHKRVIAMFGANWCYDCHVLDTTLHSKEFAPLVEADYVPGAHHIGEEGKDNNDLAAVLGVGLNRGIPSLGVLEPDGKVVFAQKDGEFESTVKIGPEDVRAFLEKWKPASSGSHGCAHLRLFQAAGFLPGVKHAVDHRNVPDHRDHPEHRGHPVEQRADDQQHHALGPLHEPHLALRDAALGPRPGVAHHHGGGHHHRVSTT